MHHPPPHNRGNLALIAGHPSEQGVKHGRRDEARFNFINGLAMERERLESLGSGLSPSLPMGLP